MSLQPLNDLAKIELDDVNKFGFVGAEETSAESGILVSLPDRFNYFGFWSFAFEDSFMNYKALDTLYKYWQGKINQRVFWTALSEKGNIISLDKKRYAFVKFTSLIASDDADSTATNTTKDGSGSFKA